MEFWTFETGRIEKRRLPLISHGISGIQQTDRTQDFKNSKNENVGHKQLNYLNEA